MIKIRSKKAGFRRCGIAHPKEEAQYPDDRFSKEELAILKAEPMLTVEIRDRAPISPSAAETGKEPDIPSLSKGGKKGKR